MSSLEINASSTVCRKCGLAYSRLKDYFSVSYAFLYKGQGYLPYCRNCVDAMYDNYFRICRNEKAAARQVCRKLDLYWNEAAFEATSLRSTPKSFMSSYIARLNSITYSGKSYDDTLNEEGALWTGLFPKQLMEKTEKGNGKETPKADIKSEPKPPLEVDPEVLEFWGEDYAPEFLIKLDKRYKKWTKDSGEHLDPGAVSLFKHICILEETIAADSAAGKPFDKNLSMLNTLLGSLNMKPAQKNDEVSSNADNSPLGVWVRRFENERPIPEPDPELKDVDRIVRYIQVFFLGHLAKMLGKTTVYSKMYDEEIARLRVEDPELSAEYDDNEEFFENRFAIPEDGGYD